MLACKWLTDKAIRGPSQQSPEFSHRIPTGHKHRRLAGWPFPAVLACDLSLTSLFWAGAGFSVACEWLTLLNSAPLCVGTSSF
jgi:hypothetical protein